jgi:nicotinate-nucleotide pyrophosphorylase (carboxylating)
MATVNATTPDIIEIALEEDVGPGDLTAAYFCENREAKARIFAKESAVLSGGGVAAETFRRVDQSVHAIATKKDGSVLRPGETVLQISGPLPSLLTAERVALNFLQHLSGVASITRKFVDAINGTNAQILDTRKTAPGLRALQKKAVLDGGGTNHRMGLFDMVMVKDNHLAAKSDSAELQRAILKLKAAHPGVRVELEADTIEQVRSFLKLTGVDVILLDNMNPELMREAVTLAQQRVKLEASGGVTLETIASIAATGVDYISIGALTHSVRAIDFSMEILTEKDL